MPVRSAQRARKGWLDYPIDVLGLAAAVLLVLITLLIVVDVAGRSVHLFALPWSLEATEYMLYGVTFFGAPWLLRDQGHIAVEIVVERLPAGARRALRRVTDVIGALICLVLLVYSCRVVWASYSGGIVVQKSFVFPEWYPYAVMPPVMFLLLCVYLRWLFGTPPPDAPGPER